VDSRSGGHDKGGKKGSFKVSCFKCGKNGHRATDCWDDEKNASKAKYNNETGAAAVDSDTKVEYLLNTVETEMTFPATVWIGDVDC
jgi:Zinc knuckle